VEGQALRGRPQIHRVRRLLVYLFSRRLLEHRSVAYYYCQPLRSIDFVLAYPQAAIKTDIYMTPPKVPPDFVIPDLPTKQLRLGKVYKLLQNLYGLKDAGRTWYNHLRKGLLERGWRQSEIDGCLFTKSGIVLVVYVNDAILISPSQDKITSEISSLMKDYV
jgi:hypothetical protein